MLGPVFDYYGEMEGARDKRAEPEAGRTARWAARRTPCQRAEAASRSAEAPQRCPRLAPLSEERHCAPFGVLHCRRCAAPAACGG